VSVSVAVRVARSLQILVSALSPHILLAATPHMAPILLFLEVVLAAFNSAGCAQGASDGARELSMSLLLTVVHEYLLIELIKLNNLVDCVSLVRKVSSVRATRTNSLLLLVLSLVVNDCISAVLIGSAGLRTLHFELLS
jgi:hypothetical protein